MFQSIESESIAEIIEKKSKFIAILCNVNSKEEAEKTIQDIRKKYYDAKHHCYAYIVNEKNDEDDKESLEKVNNFTQIEKCSDDGEPSGTAGAPLLSLLKASNLSNVIIIVIRYFGGILLGTGGLVRAYTESAQNAINNAKIVKKDYGIRYKIEIKYGNLKEIQYICKNLKINIVDIEYNVNIKLTLESNIKAKEDLEKEKSKIINLELICSKFITIQ